MCGIVGIALKDGTPEISILHKMMSAIAHRGPDGSGQIVKDKVVLGHTRLSIIDLKTGDQPISNVQGDQIIANGEIYNFVELRDRLGTDNFSTLSDCEAPLILFQSQGKQFAEDMRGMYAITIVEGDSGEIYLSRDRFGIKPLYICEDEKGLSFASEIGALIEANIIKPVLNTSVRDQLLQQQFTHGKVTAIKGVERVLPGETLRIGDGKIIERLRHSALPIDGPADWNEEEAIKLLDDVLMDSVAVHQRSDVPYGLFLSGGVDSSAILACMRELNDRPVEAFTAGFSGTQVTDERAHAQTVAKAAGANFYAVDFNEDDFWNLLPTIVGCLDDPTSDYAVLPTFKLGALARERGIKVVLTGEGGDELFAGYGRYRRLMRPWWMGGRPMRHKGIFEGSGILREPAGSWNTPDLINTSHRSWTKLQQAQAIDCAGWLPNDLLIKLDRCLMAHGVEGRTPFLDLEVANMAMRLPDRLKIRNNLGKYILRKWLSKKLPEAKPMSPKKGFSVPVAEWISKKARLSGELVAAQPCIGEIAIASRVRALFSSLDGNPTRKAGQMAWTLLFYALWYRFHIDRKPCDGDVFDNLSIAN